MASFPTTNKTFASRSNGAVIDASHVGDLQDEVAALEDGYLNATARLNSSNSTVANLSVTGKSTLTGTVQITGASTLAGAVTFGAGVASTVSFASSVTFSGAVTITGALTANVIASATPTVKLRHSANQAAANGDWTGLSWDTEDYDFSTGLHSTATNSSRISFVDSTGRYAVGTAIALSAAVAGGQRGVRIILNDSTTVIASETDAGVTGVALQAFTIAADVRVASTADYVTVQVYQNSGSTASVLADSTAYGTAFWAHRVSV